MDTQIKQTFHEEVVNAPKNEFILKKTKPRLLTKASITPDVNQVEKCVLQNTAPITLTNFLHGQDGQHISILGDGFTSIPASGNIFSNTGGVKLLQANRVYRFTFFKVINAWAEDGT